ncbi:MAG: tetratricopeptide repeat protein [Acetobacteraceae bacterium]
MAKDVKAAADGMSDLLRQAIAYHQGGNLAAAEPLYRDVLKRAPHQPDALHFLGMLLHQKGDSEAGLRLVDRSLKFNSRFPRHAQHPGTHSQPPRPPRRGAGQLRHRSCRQSGLCGCAEQSRQCPAGAEPPRGCVGEL